MTEQAMRDSFECFLACRAGKAAGVLSSREGDLANSCFAAICRGRQLKDYSNRDVEILVDLAERVKQ